MNKKPATDEKWITVKIKTKTWWEIKAMAHKDGRKLHWYVEEALRGLINGKKED